MTASVLGEDMDIDARTQFCGVIGNPVGHSLSPAIHNAAFRKLGLNFVYLAWQVEAIGESHQRAPRPGKFPRSERDHPAQGGGDSVS